MPLLAGVYEICITPPPGVWMAGYAFLNSPTTGIHDELFASAIVFDDGTTQIGIVTMDLISLDFDLVVRIRAEVAKED